MRSRRTRRGLALVEAILGGVLLAAGLTVLIGISSSALSRQVDGERRLVASWLADDLLNMVLAEDPERHPRVHDTAGGFQEPFDDYAYEVVIEDLGRGNPYRVTAIVFWGEGENDRVIVETLIAPRLGEEDEREPREPEEDVDRDARWYGDEDDVS